MVKPKSADDTMLETAWESRWPPGFLEIIEAKLRLLYIRRQKSVGDRSLKISY